MDTQDNLHKIYVYFDEQEFKALIKAAVIDLREPRDVARFILRQELARRGLLEINEKDIKRNE